MNAVLKTKTIENTINMVQDTDDISVLTSENIVEIANIAEKHRDCVLRLRERDYALRHQITHELRDQNRKEIVDLLVFQLKGFRFGEFNAKKLVRLVRNDKITKGSDENHDELLEKKREFVARKCEIYRKKSIIFEILRRNFFYT